MSTVKLDGGPNAEVGESDNPIMESSDDAEPCAKTQQVRRWRASDRDRFSNMADLKDKPLQAVGAYWIEEEEEDYPAALKRLDDGNMMPPTSKNGFPNSPDRLALLAAVRRNRAYLSPFLSRPVVSSSRIFANYLI